MNGSLSWFPVQKPVFACRNKERVDRAMKQIQQVTGNSTIQGYTFDLSSLKQVRQLAAAVQKDCPQIHLLINNAGVYEQQKRQVVFASS
jgi:short-subunit dehydrogenase